MESSASPFYSIIMPVYNVESFVAEAIDSVLKQSFKDWELIIVNDGSTDASPEIIEGYSFDNEKIKLVHQENQGLSGARNAGLEMAKGHYVYFLDSDDYIKKETLQTVYDHSASGEYDIVFFDTAKIVEGKEEFGFKEEYLRKLNKAEFPMKGSDFIEDGLKRDSFYTAVPFTVLKRTLLLENKLKFPEGLLHEDTYFTPLAFYYAKRVNYINQKLYMRRIRPDSIMTSGLTDQNLFDKIEIVNRLHEFAAHRSDAKQLEFYISEIVKYIIKVWALNKDEFSDEIGKKVKHMSKLTDFKGKLAVTFPRLFKCCLRLLNH